jgi:hypothetical protein
LEVLREEVFLASKVNKDFNGAAGKLGQTVSIAVPYALSVGDVTPGPVPPTPGDIQIASKTVTIDKWKKASFHMTEQEATYYQTSDIVPNQVAEAARALARTVNQALFGLYPKVYGFAGTAGTNPFGGSDKNVNPVADVRQRLSEQLCPENNRILLVGFEEEAAALKTEDLKRMMNAGDSQALRKGVIGEVFGMTVLRDRDRPVHTAGTLTSVTTDGATAAGAKLVAIKKGQGGAISLKQGDIITFEGQTQTYAVQADLSDDGDVAIEPALVTALVDGKAVSVKATHNVNLAFEPNAFALVMRMPPTSIEGAPTLGPSAILADPVTGIPARLSYFPGYHLAQWELSILFGADIVDARRTARLAG